MANCIFCNLAGGEIPTATLFENDEFRVILDAGPATKGHCLVLPKAHYANVFEIPDDLLGRAHGVAKMIAQKMTEVTGCDGINIVQNNGEEAGQTVFHFHIHVIPRYAGEPVIVGWHPGELEAKERAELVEAFAAD